jgi:hypothetical protein
MARSFGNLRAAHRGYIYQDVVTAYFMALCLANQSGILIVDKKLFPEDRFDDLGIHDSRGYVKRQFKKSDDPNRPLRREDLTQDTYGLRLNYLLRTFMQSGENSADEYRLCVPWIVPTADDIAPYLEEIEASSSFESYRTRIFKLRASELWPEGKDAIWSPLKKPEGFTRTDFINFSQRFLIELQCPQASLDFRKPHQLEKLLIELLTNRIGIGRYPNQNLDAAKTTEVLAWRACEARANGETIQLEDIERHLQLHRDYGRVAQTFPVVRESFVSRDQSLEALENTIKQEAVTIVVGPPGSGKSWFLDHLAEKLRGEGHLVARHYCYLEPGDELVERRVTVNVLFANLIADLVETAPELRKKASYIYSAGLEELESMLPYAVEASTTGQVYLFVDGIDHIIRVISEVRSLTINDTDIVEELVVMKRPSGVHLVIGTQPGPHIEPLQEGNRTEDIPAWSIGDIAELGERLGVFDLMHQSGFTETDDELVKELAAKADGNPLYATYLYNGIKNNLNIQTALDPISFIKSLPLLQGEIANYYEHLLKTSDAIGGSVANLLGAIDFGVTEQEIKEILSSIAYQIPKALNHLRPVLKEISAQGGIQVYHESFRRFILDRLQQQKISLVEIINPIISWLESRGFWSDAKSYRFLLPLLRRADQGTKILALVGYDFASKSVSFGHPRRAIDANLDIAIEIAAEELNWAALARYAHVRRSIETCFEENLDPETYGRTYATLYGYQALADRLLFDGRPTTGQEHGLVLCSICDDAGITAPWQQYLDLNEFKPDSENLDAAIAQFHGRLRIDGPETIFPRLIRYLNNTANPPKDYLKRIFHRYIQFAGKKLTTQLLSKVAVGREIRAILELEFARVLKEQGDLPAFGEVVSNLMRHDIPIDTSHELLCLGGDVELLKQRYVNGKTQEINLDTTPPNGRDAQAAELWVASVGTIAYIVKESLDVVAQQIEFGGWYGLWLHYVIALSRIEVEGKFDAGSAARNIIAAFQELAKDISPFEGDPRACDLYPIWSLIHSTVDRGLRLVQTEEQWITAAKLLAKISYGTTTYLQGSQSGPLIPEALANIIMPYPWHSRVIEILEEQVKHAERHGEFYSVHASHEMFLSRVLQASGQHGPALEHWCRATQFMCAYGWRKDIALFDLLECATTLAKYDPVRTATRLAQAQELTEIVVDHTDGKETNHTPNYWFRSLCNADLPGAIDILYRSLIQDGGTHYWILERAVIDVAEEFATQGDPTLLAFIFTTEPFDEDHQSFLKRLDTISRVLNTDRSLGVHLFKNLVTQVQGDGHTFNTSSYEKLLAFAAKEKIFIPPARLVVGREDTVNRESSTDRDIEHKDAFDDAALFPKDSSPLQIIAWIRNHKKYLSSSDDVSRLVLALVNRLCELVSHENQIEAIRIIRYVARYYSFGINATLLADLAKQLEDRGCTDIAALTWALAYSRSRGGGGWLTLGGIECHAWVQNGLRISAEHTLHAIATEVAFLLHEGLYSGISQHLVEMCAEFISPESAFVSWDAAYEVLRHRLPENSTRTEHLFMLYQPDVSPKWEANEALFLLLIARVSHPELKRKAAAIAGCTHMIKSSPDITATGLRQALSLDTPISSKLILLQLLAEFETPPFMVSSTLHDVLEAYCQCEYFGLRWLSAALLERIGRKPTVSFSPSGRYLAAPVSPKKLESLSYLDRGERFEKIARIWPDFPDELIRAFDNEYLSKEENKKHSSERHNLATSRVYKVPETRMLFWEHEVFEDVFHRVLTSISEYLISKGTWKPGIEYPFLNEVLPNILLHVGHWNSRVVRPQIPLPSTLKEGVDTVSIIQQEDEFNGWYRCAYYEEELIVSDRYTPNAVEEVTATGGIVFSVAQAYAEHKGDLPFGVGRVEVWLEPSVLTPGVRLSPFSGPLIGFDFIKDYLGLKPLLIIHPSIAARCGLQPTQQPSPLALVDNNGEYACIFRYWSVRTLGSSISEETPRLSGCDIIVRPDIFEQIRGMSQLQPIYMTTILRKEMKKD